MSSPSQTVTAGKTGRRFTMSTLSGTLASGSTPSAREATSADSHARKQAVTHEFHLLSRLLALDSTRLNRLVAREAKETRKEITTRYREWAKRLGKQQRRPPGGELMGLDDAIRLLMSAVAGQRSSTRGDAAELILGIAPGLDAFASSTELAAKLGKAPQRGIQLLKELQADWAQREDTGALLDAVTDIARQVITDFGGVAAVTTLTAEIRARLPETVAAPSDAVARERADRAAGGLLRVALDRLSEHETASGDKEFVRRRHGRRLALLATDELLLAAAESAGRRADEFVGTDPNAMIVASTAAREMRAAFETGYRSVSDVEVQIPLPSDQRLVRLAAAISKHAGVSGRGELHNTEMSPAAAVQVALKGLAQTESLSPSQIRGRVAARFPDLDRIPLRPQLDSIVAQTDLDLNWNNELGVYQFSDPEPASATTMHTRKPTGVPAHTGAGSDAPASPDTNHLAVLRRSIDERGFVAVGVPIPPDRPGEHERLAHALAESYSGQVVDVTAQLIAAMRDLATRQGVSWDLIRGADAADPGSRDARGLRAVVDRVVPQLWEKLQQAVFEGPSSDHPLILTEVSPLARYGHLDILAKLSDLSAPRRRPVWVVIPQLRGQQGALVDRKPIQLGSPDALQLAQRVRAAQLMPRVGVGVVGRPRIVHRNTCEPREDSGVVDPGAAAFRVAGDQGVLAGAGAVHPVQLAGHPQPGLVEPGDIGLGDSLFHGAEEAAEPVGGAFGHRRDGALRDRGAEQFGQRLRGALLRQELSHIQIQHDRGDPRPVLDRRGHPLGCGGAGGGPAAAAARHQLVLDDPHRHRRQVEHLPPLHRGFGTPRQVVAAPAAASRLVPLHLVRVSDHGQRRPRMPWLPTRFASAPAPQRLRRRLGERRVGRRRLRRIRRILIQPAAQFRDLSPKTSHYRLQVLDRLPQRGVFSRELHVGRTPIIRHHTMIRIPP